MKKDKKITLGLLAVMVGTIGMGGCAKKVVQSCVDKNNVVIDDKYCEQTATTTTTATSTTHYGAAAAVGGAYMYHRWYYSSRRYPVGYRATGGSFVAPKGRVSIVKSSSSRGVFGRSSSVRGSSSS